MQDYKTITLLLCDENPHIPAQDILVEPHPDPDEVRIDGVAVLLENCSPSFWHSRHAI